MTLNIMTLNTLKLSVIMLSVLYVECHLCSVSLILSVANKPIMLNAAMLSIMAQLDTFAGKPRLKLPQLSN
jgi:hypothetical protein